MKLLLTLLYFINLFITPCAFVLMDFEKYTGDVKELKFDLYLNNAPNDFSDILLVEGAKASMGAWNVIPNNQLVLTLRHVHMRSSPCPYYNIDLRDINVICFKKQHDLIPALARFRGFSIENNKATTPSGVDIWLNPDIMLNIYMYYNALVHEFGHANLLDHSQYYGTAMSTYFTYLPDENIFLPQSQFIYITQDDMDGISYIHTNYIYHKDSILTMQRYAPVVEDEQIDQETEKSNIVPMYKPEQVVIYPPGTLEPVVVFQMDWD